MDGLSEAAAALAGGAFVLVQTDTVVGLAASPDRAEALCTAKGREGKPVAWVFAGPDEVAAWWEPSLLPAGGLRAVWGVSMTLVVPGAPRREEAGFPASGPAGLGLRLGGPPALADLARLAGPYLLTSANLAGAPAPASLTEVDPEVRALAAAALTGPPGSGAATPVVALTPDGPRALRGEVPEALA